RSNGPSPKAAAGAGHTDTMTHWTAKTELYLEYPLLIIGQTSRFAVHLTRLDDFKPVDSGRVEVRLGNQSRAPATFATDGPSKAGIFGVDVRPTQPGVQRMSLKLASTNLADVHDLGTVTVYADAAAAARQPSEARKEETIAFLKEQQWSLILRRITFALGGACATATHTGCWRDTNDMDIYILPADRERVVELTEQIGLEDIH